MFGGAGSLVPDERHVVCFSSRLHRDFCFASSGVIFGSDCIGILSFVSDAGIVGALVVRVHCCVVLPRVTGVSCALGQDCIGILRFV